MDWLTDPNVMEVSDQIERVNHKMFEKLLKRNEHLAVLFCKSFILGVTSISSLLPDPLQTTDTELDCKQCETVLQELENIDDEAEAAEIPIVKLEDKELAKQVGIFAHPSVVFFRNFGKESVIYSGDIKNEDAILEWLLVQKDPSNEAIEDMDGDQVRKTIDNFDSVAVFVCKYFVLQSRVFFFF